MTGEEQIDAGLLSPVRAATPVERVVSDAAWLRAILEAEAALARAQAGLGVVPRSAAEAITRVATSGCVDLRAVAVAARENANPVVALVRELTRCVAERDPNAAEYVHQGSTSQDVFDTGAMLVSQRALRLIRADLSSAIRGLETLAHEHRDTLMAGRTLAMQAVPITFGLKAVGWRHLLVDARERVSRLLDGGLPVSLGGAAGTLAGYLEYAAPEGELSGKGRARHTNRLVRAFARETGLAPQTLPWHSLRTPIADLASVLGFTAGALGKIAVDVLTLSRTEIGEVVEPGPAGRGASSAMPHKRNPVLATLIRSAALQVPALTAGLLQCVAAEDERSGGAWHAEWQPLRECLRLTGGSTHTLVELVAGLRVRPDRMVRNVAVEAGAVTSERVAAVLAPLLGRARARALVADCAGRTAGGGPEQAELLFAALAHEPATAGKFSLDDLVGLCDPAGYTGAAVHLVDHALGQHRPATPKETVPDPAR
ncbi:3-carboxy-cis,cis-muconate cycloisomerase [Marinactinospora thermotolerans]|uniref:3-carboxy-cis,cis-muconate cycloisomerase n=1 Tax=Marinactinospora thermotolerans DSM 45154 TaxID=1122192 RepID=A0A1T4R9S0_9ACTN|nr:3-carboxy-cis,cis-muconate cycloisomerase [Marinactinospora thermotolerans]SKA12371.1 3-carboxy-cis,cis-muconate cycloisomerase [Marinactinospora thermotolerans DSM 45154]